MSLHLTKTKKETRNYKVALLSGFLGGNIASFVKWGTEAIMPPRTSDRAIPPAEMLQDLGLNVSNMVYNYSGHIVNWGGYLVFIIYFLYSLLCFIVLLLKFFLK